MPIVPLTAAPTVPRFVDISPGRLVQLVYGELESAGDLAELAVIAEATGADAFDLLGSSGEVGLDPRTGPSNPHATPYDPDVDTEIDEVAVAEREVPSGLDPAAGGDVDRGEDVEESVSPSRPPLPRPVGRVPRRVYDVAAAVTSDLIEAWLRGSRDLARWAAALLSRRDAVLPRLSLGALAVGARQCSCGAEMEWGPASGWYCPVHPARATAAVGHAGMPAVGLGVA